MKMRPKERKMAVMAANSLWRKSQKSTKMLNDDDDDADAEKKTTTRNSGITMKANHRRRFWEVRNASSTASWIGFRKSLKKAESPEAWKRPSTTLRRRMRRSRCWNGSSSPKARFAEGCRRGWGP